MEQIPHDDWTDQDLLTRDEATTRLLAALADIDRTLRDPEIDAATREELSRRRDAIAATTRDLNSG